MNRTQYRTRVLQAADAVGSERWDATAGAGGEIDPLMSVAYDREWGRALDAAPTLRMAKREVTIAADSTIAIADLSTASERLRRILRVSSGQNVFSESRVQEWAEAEDYSALPYVWYRMGTNLYLLPQLATGTAAKVWVTHLPARVDALEGESDIVTPEHGCDALFEQVCVYEAAAMVLAKGGAETGEAAELRAMAEPFRVEYLQTLARLGDAPLLFRYSDSREEWGG